MTFELRTIVSQPFAQNTYLLWRPGRDQCVVIDPGLEPDKILEEVEANGLQLAMILNTHGHCDHIAGNGPLKDAFPAAPILIGYGDAAMLTNPMANLSGLFGFEVTSPAAELMLQEGHAVETVGFMFEVFETPGHSPGHIIFVLREPEQTHVFGGDVLFNGSIGRADFPGGDMEQLLESIRTKLWKLPDNTIIYPGHGPTTTIGEEKRSNPFCAGGG